MDVTSAKNGVSGRHANVCKDILYENRHHEPYDKARVGRNKLQNPTSALEIPDAKKCLKPSPSFDCYEAHMNEFRIHAANKLSAELTHEADEDTITRHIQNGIFNFGIDLFYGSVQQNVDVVTLLREAVLRESKESEFSVPLSIYLRISPRHQFTGGLRGGRESFFLKPNSQVVLTTDRKYASRCCRDVIYVNARFLLFDVQKCDVIRVGDVVELQVTEVGVDKLMCRVIAAGEVTKRMPVRFPRKCERISAEELEDLTFAMGTGINVIVASSPEDCVQIRSALAELETYNYYLFTRLTLGNLGRCEYLNVDEFDGFLFDCTENVPHDRLVKLPKDAHRFVKEAFGRRKPIFLAGCWSVFVDPADYEIAFYYPDKYILPCRSDFLHLYEAFSHKFALEKCVETSFHDKSSTGSSTIARSIAAASFEFNADAIIMCAVSGQMAEKIAHHRPEAPIIAVTSVSSAVNYGCMHHNVWMLLCDGNKSSHKKDVHQKLVHGLRYALKKEVIRDTSKVILVYRKVAGYGFNDKLVIIEFSDDYDEVVRKAILAN